VLAPAPPRQAPCGVGPSLPGNEEEPFPCVGIHIDHDCTNQRPDKPFLEAPIGVGRMPEPFQISGEALKVCERGCALWLALSLMGVDPLLEFLDTRSGTIPAPLEFIHHKPMVRVGGIVLLPGPLGVIASGFQITR
jgi:hypothetical protein